jgi:hypothetical protein
MPEPWCSGISPGQEERIRGAVECTCELCREYLPGSALTLHGILPGPEKPEPNPKEREQNILVVCHPCHRHIHELPVTKEKLRALIGRRPFATRKDILHALGYVPGPVSPPDDQDLAKVYDDSIKSSSGYHR